MDLDPPILYAAMGCNETLALARIKHGNDLDYSEPERGTALHMAASQGLVRTVRALLEAGGDPNIVVCIGDDGKTPLDCAASRLVRRIIASRGGVSADPAEKREYPQYDIHAELAKDTLLDGLGQLLEGECHLASEEQAVADAWLA